MRFGLRLFLFHAVIGLLLLTPCPASACSVSTVHGDSMLQARNVILVIGDGMGLAHIAASLYSSSEPSPFERFTSTGLQKTHTYYNLVTDSGAAATAISCGCKTYITAVGVDHDTVPCKNLFEYAREAGKLTGLIVTSSLVHATPAGFVAHQPFRGLYESIARDIYESSLDYLVGGGYTYFERRLTDQRDLVEDFERSGYTVGTMDQMSFRKFARKTYDKSIFFTGLSEPNRAEYGRDYLPEAVAHGLNSLDRRDRAGMFMMIEGSQIDFACHDNDLHYLQTELEDFVKTLSVVLDFAQQDGNTLVVVTSDHAGGGLTIMDGDADKQKVKMKFQTTRHTPDLVPVFAYGPGAELFEGLYDNTELFHKIRKAANF